jgi:hypothetical protein
MLLTRILQRFGFIGCSGVCMRCGVKSKAGNEAVLCKKCQRVSYCSSGCRTADLSAHRQVCPFLQRCTSEADLEDSNWGLKSSIDGLVQSSRSAERSGLTGWDSMRMLAASTSLLLDPVMCVGLSAPLTLQNALLLLSSQRPPLLDLNSGRRTLVVHVPGAAAIEAAAPPAAWTMLPSTPSLHVHLVGPNLQQLQTISAGSAVTSTVTSSAASYDSFREANPEVPDIIVGLNMGLSCQDYDWTNSLHAMLSGLNVGQRLPFAFATASYEELLEEVLLLQQNCGFKLVESIENEWAWPLLLQSGTTGCDCYRKSSWLCIGSIEGGDAHKKRRIETLVSSGQAS